MNGRSLIKHLFKPPLQWEADEPLVDWSRGTKWTTGLSFEGSIHFGASGSGKSSGGVRLQTLAMMRAGYGLLYLTTKDTEPSDAALCWKMAQETGRENSIVSVGPRHALGFNILRHEMIAAEDPNRNVDLAGNVAAIFTAASELALPSRDAKGGEHIWRQATESLVRHAVTAVFRATGDLRLDDIVAVVKSAPQSPSQARDPAWCRESACVQMLERAAGLAQDRNVRLAREFFLGEFPNFPPDTRNSVLFTFSAGCADLFQREPLHTLFFARTDYTPEIMLDGAILLCDCPVLRYREVGRIANGLLRLATQRMLERRPRWPYTRPVGIVWDECQKTLLRSDVAFQETARSASCAVVAATQHIPALRDAVGPDLAANFLGNQRSKIFGQNNEPETGEYLRRLCGQREVIKSSVSKSPGKKTSVTETRVWEDALPAHATHRLKTGGRENSYVVTGFLVVGSQAMSNGHPYQPIKIHQRKMRGGIFRRLARVVASQRPCPDFRYLRGTP